MVSSEKKHIAISESLGELPRIHSLFVYNETYPNGDVAVWTHI